MNEDLILLLTAVTAIASLGAAVGAFYSARATSKAASANLFAEHYRSYFSAEMLAALRTLRRVEADHGTSFADKWRRGLAEGTAWAVEADLARRRVKHYFFQPLKLLDAELVNERWVAQVCAVDGINLFYEIVVPLEVALNGGAESHLYERLRSICGRHVSYKLLPPTAEPKRGV